MFDPYNFSKEWILEIKIGKNCVFFVIIENISLFKTSKIPNMLFIEKINPREAEIYFEKTMKIGFSGKKYYMTFVLRDINSPK